MQLPSFDEPMGFREGQGRLLRQFDRIVREEPLHWRCFVKIVQELFGAGGYTVKMVRDTSFESPGALVEREEVIEDLVIDVSNGPCTLMHMKRFSLLDSRRPIAKLGTARASS